MLNFFINYIMIGVLFCFIVDLATEYARRKGIEVPEHTEWNWTTRIMAVWIWPLGLIFFVGGFINTYFNNKNRK
jgi:hypothetical protein